MADMRPTEGDMHHYDVRQFYFGNFDIFDTQKSGVGIESRTNEKWYVDGWKEEEVFTADNGLRIVDITQNDTVRTGGWLPDDDGTRLESNRHENFRDYDTWDPGVGGMVYHDNRINPDSFTYDLGDGQGPITQDIDSVFDWEVEVTTADGATHTITMLVIQVKNGDVFSNIDPAEWEALIGFGVRVESIELVAIGKNNYFGATHNQSLPADVVICFTEGTMILTPDGPVAAGDLQVGDAVITKDNGVRPIRWINQRRLGAAELKRNPKLLPIRISAGALGQNLPRRDLIVSPQHRMLVESRISARLFDEGVLVAAKHLLDLPGIAVEDTDQVTYVHFAFDQHEIVFAEGAPAESFYPGRMALSGISADARDELLTLFPDLAAGLDAVPGARRFLTGREGRNLAKRHQKNHVALLALHSAVEARDGIKQHRERFSHDQRCSA